MISAWKLATCACQGVRNSANQQMILRTCEAVGIQDAWEFELCLKHNLLDLSGGLFLCALLALMAFAPCVPPRGFGFRFRGLQLTCRWQLVSLCSDLQNKQQELTRAWMRDSGNRNQESKNTSKQPMQQRRRKGHDNRT